MNRIGTQKGFSIIELLVVMAIFAFVIAGASQMFVSILSDFKQQGRLAVTNIEGVLGLEVLRRDLQSAGYGLFTDPGTVSLAYTEVASSSDAKGFALNDNPQDTSADKRPPRALAIGAGTELNGSDRLAVKATSVGLSERSDVWTYNKLAADKTNSTNFTWQAAADQPLSTDRVIMLSLDLKESMDISKKILVPKLGGGFFTRYQDSTSITAGFSPSRREVSAIYFVDDANDLKMPFNRADYYIKQPVNPPLHCANGTGTLYKAVVNNLVDQTGYQNAPGLPLLECVADMQVAFVLLKQGKTGEYEVKETTAGLTATDIRRVREVRVYILAQEGQRDRNFTYPSNLVWVGEQAAPYPVGTVGRSFDLSAAGITEWQRYRWKLYTLAVRPVNLR